VHAREVSAELKRDLHIEPKIIDGERGEFTVLVDNRPVIQQRGEFMPTEEEVTAAVRKATPVAAGS
jgi:hypothetical protein